MMNTSDNDADADTDTDTDTDTDDFYTEGIIGKMLWRVTWKLLEEAQKNVKNYAESFICPG